MHQRKQFSPYLRGVVLLVIISLFSCDKVAIDREIDPLPADVRVARLDAAIFNTAIPVKVRHAQLMEQYPQYYLVYFAEVLALGDPNAQEAADFLERFVTDEQWVYAQTQIDSVIQTMPDLAADFSEAFGRYGSMFPERKVPDVYITNTGFNYGVNAHGASSSLALGGEFFLGPENPMVKRLPNEVFPAYIRTQMKPEHLLSSALKGWLIETYGEAHSEVTMLNLMATYGKIMYTLHLMIPNEPEQYHFGYTAEQLDWCRRNEELIWQTMVKEKLLYVSDRKTLTDWVGRGPFTKGFSEESPGELAYFMGKQMVKDYMKSHPEVSASDLVNIAPSEVLKSYIPG